MKTLPMGERTVEEMEGYVREMEGEVRRRREGRGERRVVGE